MCMAYAVACFVQRELNVIYKITESQTGKQCQSRFRFTSEGMHVLRWSLTITSGINSDKVETDTIIREVMKCLLNHGYYTPLSYTRGHSIVGLTKCQTFVMTPM